MLPIGYTNFGIEPYFLLLLGLLLDAVVGEMPWLFRHISHPVVLIGQTISALESRLNRLERSDTVRKARGVLMVLLMTGIAATIGWWVTKLSSAFAKGWVVELFLIVTLVAQRSLYDHVAAVGSGLSEGGLAAGRNAISRICGRDPESLDEAGVSRAAVESCAENFGDGVVAPVFWYVVFGLPGLLVYKTVNTLDSMVGHRNERYQAFGWASARLDDLLNLIPARLAALYLILAAIFVQTANPWGAAITVMRDSGHHRSPNSGWPEAAMAGALGLALAGPRRYPGQVVDGQWIGDGRKAADYKDIGRALHVMLVACLINAGVVMIALARG